MGKTVVQGRTMVFFNLKIFEIFDIINYKIRKEISMLQKKDFVKPDCSNCANTFVDDEDRLYCVLKQKYVDENEVCDDWN